MGSDSDSHLAYLSLLSLLALLSLIPRKLSAR